MLVTVLGAGAIAAVAFGLWSRRHPIPATPAGPATGPGPLSTVLLPTPPTPPLPARTPLSSAPLIPPAAVPPAADLAATEPPAARATPAESPVESPAPGFPAPADLPRAERHPRTIPPVPRAGSTEGLLIIQLLRGELTRPQYHKAMATLAAREEARHPMPLPE
ncbi:hypothetical protein [Actinoplanes awajinensis]|uniref:Uncharacterized protein n=1 Tax=Actinoplanes awajinensis subsp. mycoplanecinus TaxID=135947 RepID=A0A0X3VBM9_9ACTN|nr:hypothetical protein [Actinoplanes awajinensis]KUL42145.1 hypothetical protein ADL15_01855 [Actinoplanes awajinensis subsp. mycoplanecinus]